ncbi:hypothetical protein ACFLVS_00755 [Chloroflexota bacterium]
MGFAAHFVHRWATFPNTCLAVKAYARGLGLTVVGAHRLIIREGLRSLFAKEKQKDREVIKKVLGLYQEFKERKAQQSGDADSQ